MRISSCWRLIPVLFSIIALASAQNPAEQLAGPRPAGAGDSNTQLARWDGALRKLTERELLLQTKAGSMLRFRLLVKTQFIDAKGVAIRDSLLRPGDQLSVLANPDDYETAVRVVLRPTQRVAKPSIERPPT
jgi:hypothetical protein